jgi:uncharacterized protein
VGVYFLDSSAIVKRYVNEVGTAWIAGVMDPARQNRLHAARISAVEVISAIVRRQRADGIPASVAAAVCLRFREEFNALFGVVELSSPVLVRAMDLAEKHALRAYDAVQLAAAIEVNFRSRSLGVSCILVSADGALNAAASSEGMGVDDPNTHP